MVDNDVPLRFRHWSNRLGCCFPKMDKNVIDGDSFFQPGKPTGVTWLDGPESKAGKADDEGELLYTLTYDVKHRRMSVKPNSPAAIDPLVCDERSEAVINKARSKASPPNRPAVPPVPSVPLPTRDEIEASQKIVEAAADGVLKAETEQTGE